MLLKRIRIHILHVLTKLINLSLTKGNFPEVFKSAIVIPLYKKSDKFSPTNYRPIALLSIFSKILEKVVKGRLVKFLDKNEYFSPNQFGFRAGKNTSDALLCFMSQVYDSVNDGKCCARLFVDVMKAFDTVDHSILLQRLHDAGVRGITNKWFRSYLTDRSQQVRVGNKVSEKMYLRHGIPQGSVLSGPLFLVYVNSLCNGVFEGNLVSFADDTALFYKADSVLDLKNKMQSDINLLKIWFVKNYMSMSPKTKYVIFSPRKNMILSSPLRYHATGCLQNLCSCPSIEQVSEIKYLGLILDTGSTWKQHIMYIKNKLVCYIKMFYIMKSVCYSSLMKTMYYALINSKLEYGISIWGGTYLTSMRPLIILQKCFVTIILNRHRLEHTDQLFIITKILPLRSLYVFKVLKEFFNKSGDDFETRLETRVTRRILRVKVPKPNLSLYKKFFGF